MIITDPAAYLRDGHRPVPTRIVSLVPSQTELLTDLGLRDRLIGITKFCVHPKDLKKTTAIVGGTKNLRMDVIRGLHPDLIIANREENDKEQVTALAADFPVWVSDVATVAGALQMISDIGQLTGTAEAAAQLVFRIQEAQQATEAYAAQTTPLRTLYLIWQDPWMSVGGDTFIHDMMQKAGLLNVCGNKDRYPALTTRDISELQPEVILLSSEPFPFGQHHVAALREQFPDCRIQLADGEYFSWYGSRLVAAFPYMRNFVAGLRQSIS